MMHLFYFCFIFIGALRDKIELAPLRLQWLLKQSEHYLSMGIDKFENTDDLINLALLYSNMGRLYRHVSYYSSHYMISYGEFIKNEDFTNKVRFNTVIKYLM